MATDFSVIVDGSVAAFLFDSGWDMEESGEMYGGTSWAVPARSGGGGFIFLFEGLS